MIRFVCAACVAAFVSACAPPPAHLVAPADPRAGASPLASTSLMADARRDEIGEPGDWRDLNRRVGPAGGANAP
jgi:hypothetical protein